MAHMYVRSGEPAEPGDRKQWLSFRRLTPQVIESELRALATDEINVDAIKRCASRLNTWISQQSGDEYADVASME